MAACLPIRPSAPAYNTPVAQFQAQGDVQSATTNPPVANSVQTARISTKSRQIQQDQLGLLAGFNIQLPLARNPGLVSFVQCLPI